MGVPCALFAVFTLVPGVSRTVFRMWSCKKYLADDSTGASIEFLMTEMSVQCSSDEHDTNPTARAGLRRVVRGRPSAPLPVLTHHTLPQPPVAIPLLCLAAVVSCRKAIREGRPTDWSIATQLLHYECAARLDCSSQ
eukprot:7389761-Prymnesium_polylepis.1